MSGEWQALVLAGGLGSRFGGGKLLAPYRGGVLIDGALAAAFAAPVRSVIVATGHGAEGVAEAAAAFAVRDTAAGPADRPAAAPPLRLVHAADYAEGMAATLRAGVAALDPGIDGAFVFLADMPRVPHDIAGRLAQALGSGQAAAPVCGGVRGHPVLFTRALFPALLGLRGERGGAALLGRLGPGLAQVEVEAGGDGVLFDVDRWADLAH